MNNSPENDIWRGKIETVLCAANRRSVLRPGRFLARNLVELFIKERYARNSGSHCVIIMVLGNFEINRLMVLGNILMYLKAFLG